MSELTEFELPDGTVRKLGNIVPPEGKLKLQWREFGSKDDEKVIPRGDWDGILAQFASGWENPFLPPVADQDGVGQCNCSATATALEAVRMEQGLPYVQLSAGDLYDRINGGVDRGSLLEDGLAESSKNGIGTVATCGYVWSRRMKTASSTERAKYRVLEFVLCPTFDHCFSAVLQGWKLISGIMWYSNYNPDRDGWLPNGRGSAGGHAIFGYKPTSRNGRYGIWHQNSWGPSWGLSGHFVIPEECYNNAIGGWWGVRAVVDEGNVIPNG